MMGESIEESSDDDDPKDKSQQSPVNTLILKDVSEVKK